MLLQHCFGRAHANAGLVLRLRAGFDPAGSRVALDDHKGHFQPKRFRDSITSLVSTPCSTTDDPSMSHSIVENAKIAAITQHLQMVERC